jgi:hypothetical protein
VARRDADVVGKAFDGIDRVLPVFPRECRVSASAVARAPPSPSDRGE